MISSDNLSTEAATISTEIGTSTPYSSETAPTPTFPSPGSSTADNQLTTSSVDASPEGALGVMRPPVTVYLPCIDVSQF